MKNINIFFWCCIPLILLTSCSNNESSYYSTDVPDGYSLSFHDEFNSLSLDTSGQGNATWAPWWVGFNVRYLEGNNDKAWKCDASYQRNGTGPLGITMHEITDQSTLLLYGRKTPANKLQVTDSLPFIGGMISADNSYSQTYGYFEIRGRFELSKGHHWAIWLLPEDDSWPPEIDILEIIGNSPERIYMNAHRKNNKENINDLVWLDNIPTNAFHRYGFQWTADSMKWFLDGKVVKRIKNYVHKDMYLIVSPEIGGNWPGMPDSSTVWPTICELDYVRIYAKRDLQ